jgi:hypothetical protein
MGDVTANALRGLVKTLDDVVAPAIPADDPLALQELRLSIRYLNFARERVDHLYARARYELGFYTELLGQLVPLLEKAAAPQAGTLETLRQRGQALLAEPGAGISDLRSVGQEMTSGISGMLEAVTDPDALSQIEPAVVLASAEITAFDRSWYAPMKLERFPDQVRPLNTFIPV